MRLCLISSEHGLGGGLGPSVQRLARLLALEHEVTVIHSDEGAIVESGPEDPPDLRHLVADRSRLPPIAFACDDHAHSAAALLAIEDAYGDEPPDYLEAPDYRGHGLVPLQARNAGHRSLRGCATAVRLRGMAEPIRLHDGTWSPPQNRIVFDLEREALRLADRVLWPGGDVLAMYERYLGPALPGRTERLRLPIDQPKAPPELEPRPADEPLRILYAGRLQRAKGVLPLVEACMQIEDPGWSLTMIGTDTETAPLNWSMRATIETMCAGDERVSLHDPLPHDDLQRAFPRYDLLAVPSQFEVWANVALEAMRAGLPVLAAPVGGLTEIVADGVTGWHAAPESTALESAIRRLLANRDELERVRASGEIFRRFQRLTDPGTVLAEYRDLLGRLHPESTAPRRTATASSPLVTGIVPYYGEHEWIAEAVGSLLEQTHRNLEVTIVSDGSFEPEDGILDELAEDPRVRVLTQVNKGDNAARNLGILDAEGKYLVMLDSDNAFEPEFVERAVTMLEADPDLAYVTCWLRFVGEPAALDAIATQIYPPLGNAVRSDDKFNSDGDTMALLPRRVFRDLGHRYTESGMAGDWELYRTLRDAGRYGAVIPELLGRYRVRPNSISRAFADGTHDRAWGEALSRRRLRGL
jgi:glycogen synthase